MNGLIGRLNPEEQHINTPMTIGHSQENILEENIMV